MIAIVALVMMTGWAVMENCTGRPADVGAGIAIAGLVLLVVMLCIK
jgi:hypothetical protein